ncbi:MAG: hypothetical protein J3K34DRAFT_403552 [Monoraphidium minutum]|nr:MAG: hypothetical protein J3K34DRAFT_403552 [Monoraphidium minutum]
MGAAVPRMRQGSAQVGVVVRVCTACWAAHPVLIKAVCRDAAISPRCTESGACASACRGRPWLYVFFFPGVGCLGVGCFAMWADGSSKLIQNGRRAAHVPPRSSVPKGGRKISRLCAQRRPGARKRSARAHTAATGRRAGVSLGIRVWLRSAS